MWASPVELELTSWMLLIHISGDGIALPKLKLKLCFRKLFFSACLLASLFCLEVYCGHTAHISFASNGVVLHC
jgi:hypothetical protein